MDVISQQVNTFFMFVFMFIILLASHFTLVTPSPASTWVGSKYNIECTMCASCDNPCNQQPPSSPPSPPPPPPPSPPLCPPPPSPPSPPLCPPPPSPPSPPLCPPPTSTTGGGGYYYSPPPPTQNVYNYPQAPYKNYPSPGTPDPITTYYPYYYHNSPPNTMPWSTAGDSFSGATLLLLVLSTFCMFL